jgi:hypothetical protein
VERCKKCIACQGRYFEKETITASPQSSTNFSNGPRSSSAILKKKKGSFKTTVTHTLTTVRGMKITPLLRYPITTTWHNCHLLPMRNSGALSPIHELFKRPSYYTKTRIRLKNMYSERWNKPRKNQQFVFHVSSCIFSSLNGPRKETVTTKMLQPSDPMSSV